MLASHSVIQTTLPAISAAGHSDLLVNVFLPFFGLFILIYAPVGILGSFSGSLSFSPLREPFCSRAMQHNANGLA